MEASFDDAIALRRLGNDRFAASTPPAWSASGRAPGGLLEAQLFAGIEATVDGEALRPLSFTAHLLRAPTTQPYEVHVDVLRAGRTVWTLSARIVQDGRLIATALSSYAAERPGPDFDERPMPDVPPPSMARDTQGYRPDLGTVDADFVLIRSRTGLVRGGYLDWDVDAWAPDGTLLCQSRQMLAVLD